MLSASCPHCTTLVRIPDDKAGRVVRCPKCGGRFHVNLPDESPPLPTDNKAEPPSVAAAPKGPYAN
jgi:predicted Zn finger-like uncharacterized protein